MPAVQAALKLLGLTTRITGSFGARMMVHLTQNQEANESASEAKNQQQRHHRPKPPTLNGSAKVGIVGGDGKMGSLMLRLMESIGLTTIASDPKRSDWPSNEQVMDDADVVIFAIPVNVAEAIISELVPHSRPGQLLLDITSVKSGPMRAMLGAHPEAEVIGMHPLFGPGMDVRGQTFVVCPGRVDRWLDWLLDVIRFVGATPVMMGAARHDEEMAVVQGLTHIMYFIGAMCLRDLDGSLDDLRQVATPQFKLLWLGLARVFAQNNAGMYFSIQASLRDRAEANLKLIALQAARLLEMLETQDIEWFTEEYRGMRNFLGPDILDEAAEEFTRVNRFLADLNDRNSIEISCMNDRPGLLSQIVAVLAECHVNMTSLHSMPLTEGGYRFRITTEQRRASREVQTAIGRLRNDLGWQIE
jgi:prephenate dehydrogenase